MIGIYGGTFDPVHYGHLRTALEIKEQLALREIRFIPCGTPPHKVAGISTAKQRTALLQLALAEANIPEFILDLREIQRPEPSYTIDTVKSLRHELPDEALCLILGMDAFNQLSTWMQWQMLFSYVHIIVMSRPGDSGKMLDDVSEALKQRQVMQADELQAVGCGKILFVEVSALGVSSTDIRRRCSSDQSLQFLLPETVRREITHRRYYK